MDKSILIIDTMQSCVDCRFCREIDEGIEGCCELMNDPDDDTLCRTIDCENGYCQNRPDWCPLVIIPEELHNELYMDEYADGYDDGWNSFRNAIIGGVENEE